MKKDNQDKLNKNIIIEQGTKPEEYKGNTFVGFIVVFLFVAIILGILYYLETNNIINIVDFI